MMEWLGGLLVIFGCAYWGWLQGQELKKKVSLTSEFIQALDYMKREITQKHRDLSYILDQLCHNSSHLLKEYFINLLVELQHEGENSFASRWHKTMINDFSSDLSELLEPLGGILGQYDAKSQGEALVQVIEELKSLKAKQEIESKKMVQVYAAFGVCIGIFSVILLL